jgi:hypothetical protein
MLGMISKMSEPEQALVAPDGFFTKGFKEPIMSYQTTLFAPDSKRCNCCKLIKPVSEFHQNKTKQDGLARACKACACKAHRLYLSKYPDKVAAKKRAYYDQNKVKVQYSNRKYGKHNRSRRLISGARERATKQGLAFDLWDHAEEIKARIAAGKCELTGITFNLDVARSFDSPSIDRIIPSKGYVYTNIRIILHGMNCALGNWGEEVLTRMIDAWKGR